MSGCRFSMDDPFIYPVAGEVLDESNYFVLDGRYEDSSEEETKKKKKTKSLRQIKHEEKLKMQGKWKEPGLPYNPDDRLKTLPNSDILFQAYYIRGYKPPNGRSEVTVTAAESPGEIYVRSWWEDKQLETVNEDLKKFYDGKNVPSLPPQYIKIGNACVYQHEGKYYRCRIYGVTTHGCVQLHLSDVGGRLPYIDREQSHLLKVLLTGPSFSLQELAFHCKIAKLCEYRSSRDEKGILKELLPVGTKVLAEFDRKLRRTPWRIHLWLTEKGPKFSHIFEDELRKRHVQSDLLDDRRQIKYWQTANNDTKPGRVFEASSHSKYSNYTPAFFRGMAIDNGDGSRDTSIPVGNLACATRQPSSQGNYSVVSEKPTRPLVDYAMSDSDRDETASVNENTELQDEVVTNWIASDQQRIHEKAVSNVGLTFEQLKLQEQRSIWDTESVSDLYPCLARRSRNGSSDDEE